MPASCSIASAPLCLECGARDLVPDQAGSRHTPIERVISRDDGYAVVEKLIPEEYMEVTDTVPTRRGAAGSESERTYEECEDALRTLYRLRAEWNDRKDPSGAARLAIETLIEDYERAIGGRLSPP